MNTIQLNKVTVPIIQFLAEPKFSVPEPPPNDEAPTERSEKPIAVTTLAATIGAISLIQYLVRCSRKQKQM